MEHDIVMDLLPLYHDGVCSAASRGAVEEHLKTCETCRKNCCGAPFRRLWTTKSSYLRNI